MTDDIRAALLLAKDALLCCHHKKFAEQRAEAVEAIDLCLESERMIRQLNEPEWFPNEGDRQWWRERE